MIQAAALFGPHVLGLLTLIAGLLPGLATPAGGRGRRRRWWRPAGASAPGGWRSRCRSATEPLRGAAGAAERARSALKWQPGMEQVFYERHLAMTAAPAEPRPDVTIWSETAVPFLLGERPDAAGRVGRRRRRRGG